MSTTKPEALRLAEQYDYGDPAAHSNTWKDAVCTELRRLHAENEPLRTGYAAARLEIESLKAQLAEHADELAVAYMCGASREKELAVQLVEAPLMGAAGDAGWLPIETAPTGANGYVWMHLAWGPENDQSTGSGMRFGDKFFAAATFYQLGQEQQYAMRVIEVEPTHWMPLPPAPSSDKGVAL